MFPIAGSGEVRMTVRILKADGTVVVVAEGVPVEPVETLKETHDGDRRLD